MNVEQQNYSSITDNLTVDSFNIDINSLVLLQPMNRPEVANTTISPLPSSYPKYYFSASSKTTT